MLDLSLHTRKNYEIKLPTGEVIHLKTPSQRLYSKIMLLSKSKENVEDIIEDIHDMVYEIMNNNLENVSVSTGEYGLEICLLIIQDYFDYYTKEISKVSFQQSQQVKN